MKKFQKSKAIGKEPCPKCKSRDNLVRYADGSAHCYTPDCKYFEKPDGSKASVRMQRTKQRVSDVQYDGELLRIGSRKIDIEQVRKYGVMTRENGTLIFPYYNSEGDLVATQLKNTGKRFMWTGDSSNLELFGQSQFGTGGKYLTITEGCLDALAARQMMGDYPVVAVRSASSVEADIKNNIDFIESYENVVLCFDNDEAGRAATRTACELLSPNKVKIASLRDHNDSCDYLVAKDYKKFTQGWWGAKAYTPAGVKKFSEAFSSFRQRVETEIIPLPDFLGQTKDMLGGGIAAGEITTLIADTSIGKTTLVNNILRGMLDYEDTNILYLGLETTLGELVGKMLSMEMGENLDGRRYSEEEWSELEEKFGDLSWTERLNVFDHQGSIDPEELIQRLRNAIKAFSCNVLFIDPLQQALPDSDNDTTRKYMDALLKVASQTKVAVIQTSHIRKRSSNDPHEISEDDALGSSAIKQVSYTNLLATRDKFGDGEIANHIKIQVAKARRTGNTGMGSWIKYDKATLRLEESVDPYALPPDEEEEFI